MKKFFKIIFMFILSTLSLCYYSFSQSVEVNGPKQAEVSANTFSDLRKDNKTIEFLQNLNRRISFLLWPLLFISAKTIDNSIIYGQFMGMDKYLWQLRQVMRNFANLLLGFLFVISIIFYFFGYKQDKFSPKKIIPAILIGTLVVQASWFIVAALVDLSTILTVSIGSIGTKQLYNDENINSGGVFLPIAFFDENKLDELSTNTGFTIGYLGRGTDGKTKVLLPCIFENGIFSGKEFKDSLKQFEKRKSIIGNHLEIVKDKCVLSYAGNIKIVNIGDCENKTMLECQQKAKEQDKDIKGFNFREIVNEKGLFLGPFYYLFLKILNFSSVFNDNIYNGSQKIEYLIPIFLGKAIMILMLLMPLFIFTIVMIARVVILWFVIIFSPFIFLFQTFSLRFGKFFEKFSLTNILTLIFMPVLVSLALSFGVLILDLANKYFISQTLYKSPSDIQFKAGEEFVEIKTNSDFSFSYFQDFFGWFLMNLFGILVLWSIVFAALKSNKFTEEFVERMKTFSEGIIMVTPIIPLPSGKGLEFFSVSGLKKLEERVEQTPETIVSSQYNKKFYKYYKKLFGEDEEQNNLSNKDSENKSNKDNQNS